MSPKTVFDIAFDFMAHHEGGFSDDPIDSGGPTKYGVSLRFLKLANIDTNDDNVIDIKDIKDLTKEQVKDIYEKHFWLNTKIYQIPYDVIKVKCFDFCVNMGPKAAIKNLQHALSNIMYPMDKLVLDGILGRKTFRAINALSCDYILREYIEVTKDFYKEITIKNPSQKRFINGWYARAESKDFGGYL